MKAPSESERRQPRRGNRPTTHHLFGALVGDLHLLEHLVPLLHDEGALVGVLRDVRVGHLDHLHLRLDPAMANITKSAPGLKTSCKTSTTLRSAMRIALSVHWRRRHAPARRQKSWRNALAFEGGEGMQQSQAACRLITWNLAEKFARETLRSQPEAEIRSQLIVN